MPQGHDCLCGIKRISKPTNYPMESAAYNSIQARKSTNSLGLIRKPHFEQVEISLFCTRHLIDWILKCWNLLVQFCHLIGFHCLVGLVSVNAL